MRLIDAYENEQWAKEHIFDAKERNAIIDFLRDCSTVDAVPVVHGEWRHSGGDEWCCTNCGNAIHTEGSWERPEQKYCGECGAKMDGGNSDAAD